MPVTNESSIFFFSSEGFLLDYTQWGYGTNRLRGFAPAGERTQLYEH